MAEESLTITISDKENVEWIRSKVRDGFFASAEEAIQTGLTRLREDDEELEIWLRDVVAERYDAFKANPDSGIPLEKVIKNFEDRSKQRLLAGATEVPTPSAPPAA
jgi:antitoxin ParD1/3/4